MYQVHITDESTFTKRTRELSEFHREKNSDGGNTPLHFMEGVHGVYGENREPPWKGKDRWKRYDVP